MSALQLAREASGLSQAQVADALDTSRYVVSKWERGIASPRAEAYLQMWELYAEHVPGLRLDWLIRNDVDAVRGVVRGEP